MGRPFGATMLPREVPICASRSERKPGVRSERSGRPRLHITVQPRGISGGRYETADGTARSVLVRKQPQVHVDPREL